MVQVFAFLWVIYGITTIFRKSMTTTPINASRRWLENYCVRQNDLFQKNLYDHSRFEEHYFKYDYFFFSLFPPDPSTGNYLYCSPGIIPTATYAFWTTSVLCFAMLPFLLIRSYSVICVSFVYLSATLTYGAIYNTATNLAKVKPILKRINFKVDLLLAPGLTLGGTWRLCLLLSLALVVVVVVDVLCGYSDRRNCPSTVSYCIYS